MKDDGCFSRENLHSLQLLQVRNRERGELDRNFQGLESLERGEHLLSESGSQESLNLLREGERKVDLLSLVSH